MVNKPKHCFKLFLTMKYLWIFNILDLSIALQSTEKSYTPLFKDTSLESVSLNPLDILDKIRLGS